jgi:hypothetical protein
MSGQKNIGRETYWRSVFQEHADSGLSIRRFCQTNSISEGSFFNWRKKLAIDPSLAKGQAVQSRGGNHRGESHAKQSASSKQASLESRSDDHPAANPSTSFVALNLPAANEPIEVVHPQGYIVRIPSCANLDWLPHIFQMLDRHATGQE